MPTRGERIRAALAEVHEELLVADGFDAAILGVGRRCGQPDVVVYSIPAMIRVLVERDGMDEETAREYLEFNTIGAWVGPETPVFLEPVEELLDDDDRHDDVPAGDPAGGGVAPDPDA